MQAYTRNALGCPWPFPASSSSTGSQRQQNMFSSLYCICRSLADRLLDTILAKALLVPPYRTAARTVFGTGLQCNESSVRKTRTAVEDRYYAALRSIRSHSVCCSTTVAGVGVFCGSAEVNPRRGYPPRTFRQRRTATASSVAAT